MDATHKAIRASPFVVSSLKSMERIAIDSIGPIDETFGLRYIIVIIDTFTRYFELFPKHDISAMVAVDVLWRHN